MYKKLQYTDVLSNIIIYEHNNLLKLSTIFCYPHLIMMKEEKK